MSKPSGTNYPKTFRWYFFQVHVFSCMSCPSSQNHYFWWLWSECSPLPIPNREVKPHIADDTALVCGKVGRRQFFIRASQSGCSFFIYTLYITPRFCPFQILMLICQKRVALADFTFFFEARLSTGLKVALSRASCIVFYWLRGTICGRLSGCGDWRAELCWKR